MSLTFPDLLQFLKQRVVAVICQVSLQFPSLPSSPSPRRGESWLATATAVLPRQKTSVSNEVMETRDIQTFISSNVDACKVLAFTTITGVSVCLSVLLEHRSTFCSRTGSFTCCASLSLFLCFFYNLLLKILTA